MSSEDATVKDRMTPDGFRKKWFTYPDGSVITYFDRCKEEEVKGLMQDFDQAVRSAVADALQEKLNTKYWEGIREDNEKLETRLKEAERRARDHHLEECMTCMATESERDVALEKSEEAEFVPGKWTCPQCSYILGKNLLSAVDGSTAVNPDQSREVCPKDGKTLVRFSWKQEANELVERVPQLMKDLREAQAELEELEEAGEAGKVQPCGHPMALLLDDQCGKPEHRFCIFCETIADRNEAEKSVSLLTCDLEKARAEFEKLRWDEGDRQAALLALAELSLHRPGWDDMLGRIAETLSGKEMFDGFKKTSAEKEQRNVQVASSSVEGPPEEGRREDPVPADESDGSQPGGGGVCDRAAQGDGPRVE